MDVSAIMSSHNMQMIKGFKTYIIKMESFYYSHQTCPAIALFIDEIKFDRTDIDTSIWKI